MANSILEEDFKNICECGDIPFATLEKMGILITGATGLIGSLLVKLLHYANEKYALNLTIYVLVREFDSAQKILQGCSVKYIHGDIRHLFNVDANLDYIFHCAAITSSEAMVTDPVGNLETSVNGTQNILNLSKQKNIKSIVFVSSMEAYGTFDNELIEVDETNLGYINLFSPRSCYPESKRICECMCYCYYSQYKLPVKIARLAQTFGAGVHFTENRVFAQFAKNAMQKQNIILHSQGDSYGNYCYTADVIKALLFLLLKGEDGECYNVSNEKNTMTIKQMAEKVSVLISNGGSKVIIALPKNQYEYGYAPTTKIKLKTDKLNKLGWTPTYNICDMYIRMIQHWRENSEFEI